MEHKIGTRITLEVVEIPNSSCEGCFFYGLYGCLNIRCIDVERTDHKNIIYKEIITEYE